MTQTYFINVAQGALILVLTLAGPVLIAALLVGLVIGILQAATQIQEQTLTFVPKIIVVFLALILLGPWFLNRLMSFTVNLYSQIPGMVR
jgi:flagellar biosynthetic protein FliQ